MTSFEEWIKDKQNLDENTAKYIWQASRTATLKEILNEFPELKDTTSKRNDEGYACVGWNNCLAGIRALIEKAMGE